MPNLIFILGGAASGKSNYAETLAKTCDIPRIYLATAQAFDAEMEVKIAAHRRARAADGWVTIEEPLQLVDALRAAPDGHLVLLDCLTLWLSNLILADIDPAPRMDALLPALDRDAPVIVVSNEVGMGVVPDTPLGRQFRAAQGAANRAIAARANPVITVMAGLPLALKGTLP